MDLDHVPPTTDVASHRAGADYRVLARKYRPRNFDDLIGQDPMVRTLRNAMAQGRVPHAFVLTGVRGVGKTTTARIIAMWLNCTGTDGDAGPSDNPCGVCENCVSIIEDRHVDVLEMDAASRTGVDDIRDIIDGVQYHSVTARYKVYIIDEVHMLSKQAFNALLKTLEEPPDYVKFIFATTEVRRVPVTVLSRCQRFDLRRLSVDDLVGLFAQVCESENVAVAEGNHALAEIARAADGSARDGLSILDQAIAHASGPLTSALVQDMLGLADRAQLLDVFDDLMGGRIAEVLQRVRAMQELGADPLVIAQDLIDVTHRVTRLKVTPQSAGRDVSDLERDRATALGERLSIPHLGRTWQMMLKGIGEIQQAPSPNAALEMVLIRLAYLSDQPGPDEVLKRLKDGQPASPGPAESPPISQSGTPGAAPVEARKTTPEAPVPANFSEIVALFEARREIRYHALLSRVVRPVRVEPGILEIAASERLSEDDVQSISRLLEQWTGRRWQIVIGTLPGAATLAEQQSEHEAALRREALADPVVAAILEHFPGAEIEDIRPFDHVQSPGIDAHEANAGPDAEDRDDLRAAR